MADYGPDPVSYCPGLRLRAVRFVDENTLEYDFEGVEAEDETFRLSRSDDNRLGIWVYNWDRDFDRRYRSMLLWPPLNKIDDSHAPCGALTREDA